jgi:osomolarity two-component system phosphorelay intermediate protein YPD1
MCTPRSTKQAGCNTSSEGISIDRDVFGQMLELDDEDDEVLFSKNMVDEYFAQADKTFDDMDAALCVSAVPSALPPWCAHWHLGRTKTLGSCPP